MKRLFAITILTLLFAAFRIGTASAQQPTPSDDDVNAIAKQLFCPVCENTPLDVCPTQACAQWRALIREKLAEGWTEAQIKQYFADQYGARVLSEPPRQGWYWLVYLIPPALFLVGVYILYRAFQSMKKPAPAVSEEVEPDSGNDEYLRRVEEELKKRN
ncbi:MAG: cytochrome c-type biogenesis protein CcmH [Chloroflexi bacterium]|nr:MAG: cytochrome c-type biogenesis protein CcmH [Chloroflexota bacterium]